ncbi:MAG: S8 family peptidase [candidate division WOR-3 bacterium]
MNLFLLIVILMPRGEFVPVTGFDVSRARARAEELAQMRHTVVDYQPVLPVENRIPGRIVVGFDPAGRSAAEAWVRKQGCRVCRIDEALSFLVAEIDPGRVEALIANRKDAAGVRYLEPDYPVRACHIPNDPEFLTRQWDKWVMYADLAWDVVTGGAVKVAVVDNGVEYWHPDLAARYVPGELGHDFLNGDDDPKPDHPEWPGAFHGTHVAGIIGAVIDNGLGIAGWAQVQLMGVRVLDDTGSGNTSDVASGIRWATDHGARVINLSLGSSAATTPLIEACRYATSREVVLIAASGNEGSVYINYPAALSECIAVGALGKDSRLAWFSNRGPEQEVVAPGVDVYSTGTGGSYLMADGTSMAAPEVSGVAALLLSLNPGISATKVRASLDISAVDMGSSGRDEIFGFGLVNARRALDLVTELGHLGPVGTKTKTVIRRRELSLPNWAQQVTIWDGVGRRIRTGDGRMVALRPGTYFVNLKGEGRSELVKVVVLD